MNILLTGATRGIGAEIFKDLKAQGHRVVGMSRTAHDDGDNVQGDISRADKIGMMYDRARKLIDQPRQFDVLINNAGICNALSIETTGLLDWNGAWEEMLRTNLIPAANLTHMFVRDALRFNRSARVINIGSRVAFKGQADASHYASSKAGLIGFTRSMAAEYASRKILFFSVSPCWVETDMAKGTLEEMTWDIPAGIIATPHDVSVAVSFLTNDATPIMTGMNLDLNGASYFH